MQNTSEKHSGLYLLWMAASRPISMNPKMDANRCGGASIFFTAGPVQGGNILSRRQITIKHNTFSAYFSGYTVFTIVLALLQARQGPFINVPSLHGTTFCGHVGSPRPGAWQKWMTKGMGRRAQGQHTKGQNSQGQNGRRDLTHGGPVG